MTDCELQAGTVGWALHALEPDEERRVAEHLPHCDACRQILRETVAVGALLAVSVPDLDPPPALRERILAAAAASRAPRPAAPLRAVPAAAAPTVPAATGPRPAARRWALLAAAAVVVGVVLVSVRAVLPTDDPGTPALQAERLVAAAEARDPAARQATLRTGDGTPVAVVVEAAGSATLLPVGLAPPGADRAYVLWMVGGAPAPVAVGSTGPDGRMRSVAAPPTASARSFAVSVEPAGPVPDRPSTVVADGPLV